MTFIITDSFVVAAGQEFDFTDQDGFLLEGVDHHGSPSVTNGGTINVVTADSSTLYGVKSDSRHLGDSASFDNQSGGVVQVTAKNGFATGVSLEFASNTVVNDGVILVTAIVATGIETGGQSDVTNHGKVLCRASGGASGLEFGDSGDFTNTGLIHAASHEAATGVSMGGGSFDNSGQIIVRGLDQAFGVQLDPIAGATFTNSGLISAHTQVDRSVGLTLISPNDFGAYEIDNSGTITAILGIDDEREGGQTTIVNTGHIVGGVDSSLGSDTLTFVNQGTVIGDIVLGASADVYDGASGQDRGVVYGEGGDDSLTGGVRADTLIGGGGDDVLSGGGGADVLTGEGGSDTITGGSGKDHIIYRATSDSTNAHPDQIVDITSRDVIDLSLIDADTSTDGDQAFRLVSAFDGQAGELVVHYDAADNLTLVQADVDGDGAADMTIDLIGNHANYNSFVL